MPNFLPSSKTLSSHILNLSIVQSWMSHLVLLVLSQALQIHLFAILSYCYRFHPLADFVLDVLISLALHDVLNVISWAIVDRYKEGIQQLFRPMFLKAPAPRCGRRC